jgi:hypothetical protein
VSADTLPPRQVVTGDGIVITETADSRIHVQTTALWNEPIDTTFDNCDYYRRALPVLRRQMSKERAKSLDGTCVQAKLKPAKKAKLPEKT